MWQVGRSSQSHHPRLFSDHIDSSESAKQIVNILHFSLDILIRMQFLLKKLFTTVTKQWLLQSKCRKNEKCQKHVKFISKYAKIPHILRKSLVKLTYKNLRNLRRSASSRRRCIAKILSASWVILPEPPKWCISRSSLV